MLCRSRVVCGDFPKFPLHFASENILHKLLLNLCISAPALFHPHTAILRSSFGRIYDFINRSPCAMETFNEYYEDKMELIIAFNIPDKEKFS